MPNIQRLQQLRRVVEDAPEDLLHMRAVVEEASCGTARCAAGWCAVDPWFHKQGFSEVIPADYSKNSFEDGLIARLANFFEIDGSDADALFAGDLSMTAGAHAVEKDEVIWSVNQLLTGGHALPYAASYANVPIYAGDVENPDFDGLDDYYVDDEDD